MYKILSDSSTLIAKTVDMTITQSYFEILLLPYTKFVGTYVIFYSIFTG